jgi:hypothetical protein
MPNSLLPATPPVTHQPKPPAGSSQSLPSPPSTPAKRLTKQFTPVAPMTTNSPVAKFVSRLPAAEGARPAAIVLEVDFETRILIQQSFARHLQVAQLTSANKDIVTRCLQLMKLIVLDHNQSIDSLLDHRKLMLTMVFEGYSAITH